MTTTPAMCQSLDRQEREDVGSALQTLTSNQTRAISGDVIPTSPRPVMWTLMDLGKKPVTANISEVTM